MSTPRRSPQPLLDDLPDGLAADVTLRVRQAGAIALRKLTTLRLSPRASALLHEALAREGIERTGTAARVPIAEQLARLLLAGPVQVGSLRRRKIGRAHV